MTAKSPASGSPSRCPWVDLNKPDYVAYHDHEWGLPVHDDQTLFEYMVLEAAQAGLSWYTVLKKRTNYRRAFANFDVPKVARFNQRSIARLVDDAGIIRHRQKIEAAIHNAKKFIEVQREYGSFNEYIWCFVDQQPIVNTLRTERDFVATSPESDRLAADLRQRGFKFMGSTTVYAYMQAMGLVNDHTIDCFRRSEIIATYT